MEDIAPGLLEKIRASFVRNIQSNEEIQVLNQAILEAVYAEETFYAQTADEKSTARDRAEEYAALANLIYSQIPNE